MAKTVDKYTIKVETKGARGSAQSLDKVGKGAKSMAKAMGVAKIAVAALGAALISGITYAGRTAAEFEALKIIPQLEQFSSPICVESCAYPHSLHNLAFVKRSSIPP